MTGIGSGSSTASALALVALALALGGSPARAGMDGDTIPDSTDACPLEAGPAELSGCPDADGDFVADPLDFCPDEPGVGRLAGCGDFDEDFTPDRMDACPEWRGPPQSGGCRNPDGDLLPDQFDACPAEPGLLDFGGCPSLERIPSEGVFAEGIQVPFHFGSSQETPPEGFHLCYGLFDPQTLHLTDAAIFDGVLIRPSHLYQTFELFLDDDPDFAAVVSALTGAFPEGTDFGFSVGFSDCIGTFGSSPRIPVLPGISIGSFRLDVPPFSIRQSGSDFFEIIQLGGQAGLAAFQFTRPEGAELGDADLDGLTDSFDACPHEPGLPAGGCPDSDLDGIPDRGDLCPDAADPFGCPDSDADALPDASDLCPASPGALAFGGCSDEDGDGSPLLVDACPGDAGPLHGCPDSDSDGIPDSIDGCPFHPGPPELVCSDGDADGIPDPFDNCPADPNPDQIDADGDGPGDACDADDDADGLPDGYESAHLCLSALAPDADVDADEDGLTHLEEFGLGTDPCGPDSDADGLPDGVEIYGLGAFGTDPLDPDSDGDEVFDGFDNCPKAFHEEAQRSGFNPDQADLDGDGRGNVCDPDADGDGTPDASDACPLVIAGSFDADSDGCGDSLAGFAALLSGRDDLSDSRRKTLLAKTAEAEHLLCDVGNLDGGVRKLRDLQDHLRAQAGKTIPVGTAELLSRYLENLIQQIQAGDGVCPLA